jgi:hypothetical protein
MHQLAKLTSIMAAGVFAAVATPQAARADFDCVAGGSAEVTTVNMFSATSSTSYQDLPGASVDFTIDPGSPQTCVIVKFSGQVQAPAPGGARVRILLDQPAAFSRQFVEFYASGTRSEGQTATFILYNLPAGARNVRIQFASANGSEVSVGNAAVAVTYERPINVFQ